MIMLTKTKVLGFTTSERKEAPVKEGEEEAKRDEAGINAKVTRKKKRKKERSRIMKLAFLVYRGSNLTHG